MKTKITSNILEDISKRLKGESYSKDGDNALIVFNGSDTLLDDKIGYIKNLKDNGMRVSLAFSFMAEQLIDTNKVINSLSPTYVYKEENVFKFKNIIRDYSMIIGPNITMNTLSKVSLGMIDSFITNLIWTFIYQGKKTYLDFTSVRNYLGEETKNKEISDMIERYIATVKKMGVIEVNKDNYLEKIISKEGKIQVDSNKSTDIIESKRIITERDIVNMSLSNNSLTLPKGSIVTPLARDRAREKNIKIEIK